MRDSLFSVLRAWWRSRRAFDATGSGALLRSEKVRDAASTLPKISRCSGRGGKCPAFVQKVGSLCHRCDPSALLRERQEREARVQRDQNVTRFRGGKR